MQMQNGMYVYNTKDMDWKPTGRDGICHKAVRANERSGEYLGMAKMTAGAQTGLHRHLGVGGAMMLSGQVADYFTSQNPGDYAVNHDDTVHEAFAYADSLMVVRLDAPQIFLNSDEVLEFDNGNRFATLQELETPNPDVPPDLVFSVPNLASVGTGIDGASRKLIYDYDGSGLDRRIIQLSLLPRTVLPHFNVTAITDLLVIGGEISVNGMRIGPANFCLLEPETSVHLTSQYGATVMCWAEGPMLWHDQANRHDLFAF